MRVKQGFCALSVKAGCLLAGGIVAAQEEETAHSLQMASNGGISFIFHPVMMRRSQRRWSLPAPIRVVGLQFMLSSEFNNRPMPPATSSCIRAG